METKSIILYSLIFVLAVVLVANFTGVFSGTPSSGGGGTETGELLVDFVTIESLVKAVKVKEEPVKKYVERLDSLNRKWDLGKIRDPFIPEEGTKRPPSRVTETRKAPVKKRRPTIRRPKLSISGIVMDKLKPYAVINGEVHEVGDQFGDYVIESIVDTLIIFASPIDTFTVKYERY